MPIETFSDPPLRWNTINISKIPTWVRNKIDVFQHRPNSIHTGILCFWIPSKDWILLGQYVEAEPIHIVTLMYAFDWTIVVVMFQHNLYTNAGIMVLMMTMMLVLMKTMLWVARVLIAFNLNQKVIRVNQVATTGDQDWWCKIREAAAWTMELASISWFVQNQISSSISYYFIQLLENGSPLKWYCCCCSLTEKDMLWWHPMSWCYSVLWCYPMSLYYGGSPYIYNEFICSGSNISTDSWASQQ